MKTFENYLQEKHFEENPQILDDHLPDACEYWMSNLDVQEVIAYAEEWGKEIIKKYPSTPRNNLKGK